MKLKIMGIGVGCALMILILSMVTVSANTYSCPDSCPSPDGCMECSSDNGYTQGLIKFEFNDSDGDGYDEAICYSCGDYNYCDSISINITAWDEDGEVIAFEWEAKSWVDVNEIYVKDGTDVCGYDEDPVEGENITSSDIFCGADRAMSHITFCATIDEEEIPEFPTMAIPVAIALLGAMFFLRRQ